MIISGAVSHVKIRFLKDVGAMRFGICNELFEGWALADVFAKAREIGYEGVEISPFTLGTNPDQLSAKERLSINKSAKKAGIAVIGLHWLLAKTEGFHLTSPDAGVRLKTQKYLENLVDLCADLGGRVMIFGSPQQRSLLPGVSWDQAREYAVQSLRGVAARCDARDVTFCIEPLGPEETNFINTADEAWQLAKDTGSDKMKIILDVKAMSTEGRPVAETIKMHLDHAGHVHMNDPNRRGPGTGDVDFVPIMKALKDGGYTGWCSVEVFDFKPDPVTIAKDSLEHMRVCLEKGASK